MTARRAGIIGLPLTGRVLAHTVGVHVATTGWRARIARAAAASGLVAVTLAGCARAGTHDFDRVDAIKAQVQPTLCGQVVYTGRFGSSSRAEGSPPSLVVVVVGDAQTSTCIGERLDALGYRDAQYGWFRDADGDRVTIASETLAALGTYVDAQGTPRTAPAPGIALLIRSG